MVVRDEIKYGKFYFPINQFMKGMVILTIYLAPEEQLKQLTIANISIYVYMMVTLWIS